MVNLLLFIIIACILISIFVYADKKYKKTAYYQITKNPYSSIRQDKGKYGEYLTYKYLQPFESSGGKFLFNIYIPKPNNETTEIDVLLICSKGLFVFESKNYSGWIFGNETQENWTQTLPRGRGRSHKERFYNPIRQNASHIKHLKRLIHENVPIRSIIVFSSNCTLKNITIKSADVSVINRHDIATTVAQICNKTDPLLSETEINDIYNRLHPYTQVDYEARRQHARNIKNTLIKPFS